MRSFLYGSGFSTQNYNKLLNALALSSYLQPNVELYLGSTQYSPDYADERQYIIDTYGWMIEDGGVEGQDSPDNTDKQPYVIGTFASTINDGGVANE